jgi:ABC-type sulfate transport system permease subunit
MSRFRFKERSVLPGFGLSFGYTLLYLSLLVLIPLSTLFWKAGSEGWQHFTSAAFAPQAMASYKLTFGASLLAATVNLFAGLLVAWVLVRYSFWGNRSWMPSWTCPLRFQLRWAASPSPRFMALKAGLVFISQKWASTCCKRRLALSSR